MFKAMKLQTDLLRKQPKKPRSLARTTGVLTNQDIKKAARDSSMDKWQDKWSISNTDREYFQYRPKILPIPRFDFPDHRGFILLLQLRTCYPQLKDYRQKLRQVESNRCECGEVENTEHIILECQLYNDIDWNCYTLLNLNSELLVWMHLSYFRMKTGSNQACHITGIKDWIGTNR